MSSVRLFLLTPLREGRPDKVRFAICSVVKFLLTPLREGRLLAQPRQWHQENFYSRPCGRGDAGGSFVQAKYTISTHAPAGGATDGGGGHRRRGQISTHAPAGGATGSSGSTTASGTVFLLTPLREGRRSAQLIFWFKRTDFYSRPCGRGDNDGTHAPTPFVTYFYSRPCGRGDSTIDLIIVGIDIFLLTPLREGRRNRRTQPAARQPISTHAPAGGATLGCLRMSTWRRYFYSRPCGRGDRRLHGRRTWAGLYFYSRPCGRGDCRKLHKADDSIYFYSRPCGRGDLRQSTA